MVSSSLPSLKEIIVVSTPPNVQLSNASPSNDVQIQDDNLHVDAPMFDDNNEDDSSTTCLHLYLSRLLPLLLMMNSYSMKRSELELQDNLGIQQHLRIGIWHNLQRLTR